MQQTFKTKFGHISFSNRKIEIADNAKKRFLYIFAVCIAGILFGVTSIYRYFQSGDKFLLWTGITIAFSNLLLFTILQRRTNQGLIDYDEVKSWKIVKREEVASLEFRLKTNRVRRVSLNPKTEDIQQFLEEELA